MAGDAVDVTATSSWYRWRLTRRSDYSGVLLGERSNAAGCMRYYALGGACDAARCQLFGLCRQRLSGDPQPAGQADRVDPRGPRLVGRRQSAELDRRPL
jgi:hypothetical protein